MMAEADVSYGIQDGDIGPSVYRSVSSVYQETFFKSLQHLRHDRTFCDVNLQVESQTFHCHKVVLMAGSTYFHAMFVTDMSEHGKDEIVISGVSKHIFSLLLDFIYSGEITVTEDNCEELLISADMFSMFEVVGACAAFLKNKLQSENCIGIYQFAETVSCRLLQKDAEGYINKNFLKVSQGEEFLDLDKVTLVHFLQSECLHVENEYQVFKAAIDWILHNSQERRKHIFDVMAPIRFPIISETQLERYIASLTDSDLSIKVTLQKIVSDFRAEAKKASGETEKKFAKKQNLKPYHLVPRQCSRKNIYICGGFSRPRGGRWSDAKTLNLVERYDTFYGTWHDCPGFQFSRSALGAGVVNNMVCVVGGENDMLILDSVETYDPVTYEWTTLAGLTTPRCGLGVCTIDNCMYAVGGWVGSEIGATVEKYDPEEKCWRVIAHTRSLRCWMGCVGDNGLMYIVGGCNDLGDELTSVDSFNPVTKEWATLPDLKTKRSYTAVAVLDDCLYAVGGWNETDGALNSVEKLDLAKGYWVEVAPMLSERAGACVVVVNNMLYVMGGRNYEDEFTAPSTLETMEGYNPVTDTWAYVGTMLSSRCEAAAVCI
ncbi:actin-binding protein IPP-like isoform X1 [Dreissena polymorpha]|uniref:actin-binding protein IPP-like isoform X1 n=2 Tax=Dreissena polymorpha TaxID=45954 RepID=UPI00226478D2|nr:actin-binding protein IPP-like isoform X1 [Dreissena polymorpha]XP_052255756.1 actin-binding protein IPP-like isoform X1 [Dreissena polymorpha]